MSTNITKMRVKSVVYNLNKLYDTTGSNADGSMTQASITSELNDVQGAIEEVNAKINKEVSILNVCLETTPNVIDSNTKGGEILSLSDFKNVGRLKNDGTIDSSITNYKTTDFYIIKPNISFKVKRMGPAVADYIGIALYDDNLNYIGYIVEEATSYTLIDLSGFPTAKYIRFCGASTATNILVLYDNDISKQLRVYHNVTVIEGKFAAPATGLINPNSQYNTYKLSCTENDKLTYSQYYSDLAGICFYRSDNSFIIGYLLEGDYGSTITVTCPKDTAYVAIACQVNDAFRFSIAFDKLSAVNSLTDFSVITNYLDDKAVTIKKTEFIQHDDSTSLIEGWIDNKYINAEGVETSGNGLYATTKVYLDSGKQYYWNNLINGYYAFYKKDDTVIEAHPNASNTLANPFTIPTDCAYGRFTAPSVVNSKQRAYITTTNMNASPSTMILDKSIKVEGDKANYLGDDLSIFNRGLCIGDSLTQGTFNSNTPTSTSDTFNYDTEGGTVHWGNYSYPKYLSKISGCEIVNWGIGGLTSDQWWSARTDSSSSRYKPDSEWSNFDFAIIQLGVNDVIQRSSWNSTSENAFNNIINKLKTLNNNIKIFVATIIPATSYFSINYMNFSESIRTYINSLNDDNVILIDIAKYGHTKDSMAYNCGHLSAYGYLKLAMDYKALIGSYINDNKDKFRQVQFIGTDLEYIDK